MIILLGGRLKKKKKCNEHIQVKRDKKQEGIMTIEKLDTSAAKQLCRYLVAYEEVVPRKILGFEGRITPEEQKYPWN